MDAAYQYFEEGIKCSRKIEKIDDLVILAKPFNRQSWLVPFIECYNVPDTKPFELFAKPTHCIFPITKIG